jgi:hypothetical protein
MSEGIARLDDAGGALLAQQRVVAREHALSAASRGAVRAKMMTVIAVAGLDIELALDIDEHEEGHQHRDVGHTWTSALPTAVAPAARRARRAAVRAPRDER